MLYLEQRGSSFCHIFKNWGIVDLQCCIASLIPHTLSAFVSNNQHLQVLLKAALGQLKLLCPQRFTWGLGREGRPSRLRLGQFWGITYSAELLCKVRTLGFSLRSHPCVAFPPFLSHLARSPTSLSWEPFCNILHRNLPLKICSNLTSRFSPQSLRAVPFYPGSTNTDTHRFPFVFPSPRDQHHILVWDCDGVLDSHTDSQHFFPCLSAEEKAQGTGAAGGGGQARRRLWHTCLVTATPPPRTVNETAAQMGGGEKGRDWWGDTS